MYKFAVILNVPDSSLISEIINGFESEFLKKASFINWISCLVISLGSLVFNIDLLIEKSAGFWKELDVFNKPL